MDRATVSLTDMYMVAPQQFQSSSSANSWPSVDMTLLSERSYGEEAPSKLQPG